MKKLVFVTFVYAFSFLGATGQTVLFQDVLLADGGQYHLSSSMIEWSLGEWMIESHTSDPYLESGFLHADIENDISTATRFAATGISHLNIWPNPAPSYFYLDAGSEIYEQVQLVDINGRLIQTWTYDPGKKYHLHEIVAGNYFVVLTRGHIHTHLTPISIIIH